VVSTPNKHHNATNARKLADKNLTQPGRFLLIVGQPLFTALVILINTLYRTTITTGLLVRDVFKNIPNGSKERNIDNLKRNEEKLELNELHPAYADVRTPGFGVSIIRK